MWRGSAPGVGFRCSGYSAGYIDGNPVLNGPTLSVKGRLFHTAAGTYTLCPDKKVDFIYDNSKPNGTPRKVLNVGLAKSYGWKSKHNLTNALKFTYKDFIKNKIK
mgnify:CR=1 FL=1